MWKYPQELSGNFRKGDARSGNEEDIHFFDSSFILTSHFLFSWAGIINQELDDIYSQVSSLSASKKALTKLWTIINVFNNEKLR